MGDVHTVEMRLDNISRMKAPVPVIKHTMCEMVESLVHVTAVENDMPDRLRIRFEAWVDPEKPTKEPLYYVQDTRNCVGNSMLWWGKNYCGYVCDIRDAHVWTESELKRLHRSTDVPWPKAYIDSKVSFHIDCQSCKKGEACQ